MSTDTDNIQIREATTVDSPNGTIFEGLLEKDGAGYGKIFEPDGEINNRNYVWEQRAVTLLYEGVVRRDEAGNIVPDVAQREQSILPNLPSLSDVTKERFGWAAIVGLLCANIGMTVKVWLDEEVKSEEAVSQALPQVEPAAPFIFVSDLSVPFSKRTCTQEEMERIQEAIQIADQLIAHVEETSIQNYHKYIQNGGLMSIYMAGQFPIRKIEKMEEIYKFGMAEGLVIDCADKEGNPNGLRGFAYSLEPRSMALVLPEQMERCALVETIVHEALHLGDRLRDHSKTRFRDDAGTPMDDQNDWIYAAGRVARTECEYHGL